VGAGSGMGGGIRNKRVMYKSSLRHIHDPVLSSLKMKGIRLFFSEDGRGTGLEMRICGKITVYICYVTIVTFALTNLKDEIC
jgi:hypothetical protein